MSLGSKCFSGFISSSNFFLPSAIRKLFAFSLGICLISEIFFRKEKSSISLFFTATIPMDYELFHKIPAFLFFFTYNLFVFSFGLFRSFKHIRAGVLSIFIGLTMTFSLLLPFKSYGVFEIVYFALILLWNIYFLFKRMKEEGMKSNKEGFLKFFQ